SRYVYGNGIDEPVQIEKRNPSTGAMDPFIPMQDTNGSVLGLTDGAGNLVERVQYTPYGKPTFIYDHEPPKVDQVRFVDGVLRIRFSESVDRQSAEAAIKVKQGADVIGGTVAFAENDRLAIFTPTSALPQIALTVQITTALKDQTGNALVEDFTRDFTPTGVSVLIYDRGPPKVQSVKLIAGNLRIDFDEEIDPASIANSVDLLANQNATVAITLAAQGEKGINISPTSALMPGARFTLKVKTTVTDLSAKPLAGVFEQPFVFENHDKLLYEQPAESEHTTSSVANTINFQARDFDPETNLTYARGRYFSPELGRFLQPDPMGYADSTNLYVGFGNNPANMIDPMGLEPLDPEERKALIAKLGQKERQQERDAANARFRAETAAMVELARLYALARRVFIERHCRAPRPDEIVWAGPRATALYGDGRLRSGSGEIDSAQVEVFMTLFPGAVGLKTLAAGGTVPAALAATGDEFVGQLAGINPSSVSALTKLTLRKGLAGPSEGFARYAEHDSAERHVAGLPTKPTPSNTVKDLYEIEQTGPVNYLAQGGGETVWIDGSSGKWILEAKFIQTPGRSPFIPGSNIPEWLRLKIQDEVRAEFRRIGMVIADPSNPLSSLRVITNDARAQAFFESLMKQYEIPGEIVIRK
ncbi:MAG: Ig-like domain-containing protein, partial [Acidobacteria bacterium]|nr:Ig-like domain-containing protein [Acidobacteriota bacterium]